MTSISQAVAVASQHHRAGRLAAAEEVCRRILAVEPGCPAALDLLALMALQADRPAEAVEYLQRAIAGEPDEPRWHLHAGKAYLAAGDIERAAGCLREAVRLEPELDEAWFHLGLVCRSARQLDEAVGCYRRLVQLRPEWAMAHNNLGVLLQMQEQLAEATVCYREAVRLDAGYAEAWGNLGHALRSQGRLDEAVNCHRRAVGLDPNNAGVHSNLLFTRLFQPGVDARTILAEHRGWERRHALPLAPQAAPHAGDRAPGRRLRIGYVSPDFRGHVIGHNLLPLLREHDHREFEIFCYADLPYYDDLSRRFQSYSDVWRDVTALSDEQLAQVVRDDHIDILVDLALHLAGNRLLVFARKPAPVQATFAGYPGTTGLTAIDYRLTDPYLDPPGLEDECYAETSLRLPETFWCYDPRGDEPEVGPLPAEERKQVTFGCLNNFSKVNPQVVRLWGRVLAAVPGARLLLMAPAGDARQDVLEVLSQAGIAAERIEFVAFLPRAAYLETYRRIDVGLDTFPYTGHTTSLDAFYMGVPVVSLVGATVVGRAGASQLTNLGLSELIARSEDDFLRIAMDLAGDLPRLAALRAGLRARMQQSPLMDATRFARNIEAAYRVMWRGERG